MRLTPLFVRPPSRYHFASGALFHARALVTAQLPKPTYALSEN